MENNKINKYIVIVITIILIVIVLLTFNQKKENNQVSTPNTKLKEAVIFTDERCPETICDIPLLEKKLKESNSLKNTKFIIKKYSGNKEEIKNFMRENNVKGLPLVIFKTNKIDEKRIDGYLWKSKDWKYFLLAGLYNPIAQDKLEKRETKTGSLDVFTMGYCPFWEIALKTLPKLKEIFWNDWIKLNIHYIADTINKNWDINDLNSLHWIPEVKEDIRQLCIKKYYWIDTLIDYLQERYKNPNNRGQISELPEEAYKIANIDKNKINKCEKEEGINLLKEDLKLAQELGIWASPTWLANNKYKFWGIKINNIKNNFCKYNSNFKGCNEIINEKDNTWISPTCGG